MRLNLKETSFLAWWNSLTVKAQQEWLEARRRDGRDKTDVNYPTAYTNQK